MKRNNTLYTICFLLASMCINTACEDTLSESPDSSYERKDFFITDKQADMAVLGIYSVLPTIYGDKDGMAFPCSDDTYYASGTNSDNTRRDICHYTIRPANTWVDAVWVGKYQQINRANYTIAGIENMDGYSESEVLQAFVAEAKFLRAQAAFDLVRYWGDVPFSTNYTTDYEASYKPRTEREEIYEQIIKDLDFAKEHLKWANDSSSPERATQGSARALLHRRAMLQKRHPRRGSRPAGNDALPTAGRRTDGAYGTAQSLPRVPGIRQKIRADSRTGHDAETERVHGTPLRIPVQPADG